MKHKHHCHTMKFILILSALMFCASVRADIPAYAVSASAQTNTEEHAVRDVQLAIQTTNSFVHANAELGLTLTVTNASDLTIVVAEGFHVNLVSDSGEKYKLVAPPFMYLTRKVVGLKSGESHEWNILVTIPKDVAPGNYIIEAARSFSANNKVTELKSNPLKMVIN
jgi:hypothetical protein